MQTPQAPAVPDPKVTAAAQTGMNVDTAQAQQLTNMVNQSTPQGSLSYSQDGTRSFVDSSGKTVNIPNYTATTTLSPAEQQLFNTNEQTKQGIAQIGLDETGRIGSILGTPLDLSNNSVEDRMYSEYSPRVLAQQGQQNEALDAQLAAQGVTPGSEAYNNAIRLRDQGNNDQWNQLYLGGRNQADQEMITQRQEPINEVSALMGGSQVAQPNFTGTPTAGVAGTDYTGAVQNQYQDQYNNYAQQVANNNAMMGGIFGTLGTALGGWATGGFKFSDRRLKTAIEQVGHLVNGLGVYAFNYIWGGPRQLGLMSDEVRCVRPEAVKVVGGYDCVNYALAVGV